MSTDLSSLFISSNDASSAKMFAILSDPEVNQITVNRFDRVYSSTINGVQLVKDIFPNRDAYMRWLNELIQWTDVPYDDIEAVAASIIEGSFDPEKTDVRGSIHIATKDLTRGDPSLTVRKQPNEVITLDTMLNQGMMSLDMRNFLELVVRGRSNVLISGGSGAGKTTLTRALSWFVDPNHRILVAEDIDELHLGDILPNVVSLTTFRAFDNLGRIVREVKLEDLVKEALRMRADRIWVGETRGSEAYALVKACNSGHDGSVTTIHADSGKGAVKQLITYVMENGLSEEVAREQVAQAFHLVIQISKVKMGRRVITEITELEPVREGTEQRRNTLFVYDYETDSFRQLAGPTKRLINDWQRNGANLPLGQSRNFQ
jgi:Flp pilus assembly CpaF family ATPase